jgi:serine protease Do
MRMTLTNRIPAAIAGLCLVATLLLTGSARADVKVYQEALKSTTWVLSKNADGTSSGTGVLVDAEKKLVITNFHVVGDSRAAVIFFPELEAGEPKVIRQHYLDNVKRLGIRGRIIATDRKRDLALIQLERLPEGAKAIELAPTSISPGEQVASVGNPGSTDALWVYTSGTVRAVYQKQFRTGAGEHNFKVVETQAPINSGDSGGPVLNSSGQLVAVAQAIAPNARLVSYCIDITEVRTFMASPWKLAPLPITEVLTRAELKYTAHPTGHFEVQYDQDDKQKQSVFVTKDVEYYERADVRKVWSLARASKEPPSQEIMMKLLQQSARTKMGAWTVEQTADGEYLIIYVVKLDATATPDTLKSAMEYVSKLTVSMKKELAPKAKAESASDTLEEWLKK